MSVNVVWCSEVFAGSSWSMWEIGIRVGVNPLGKMGASVKVIGLWAYECKANSWGV